MVCDNTHFIFYYPFNYRQYDFRRFEKKLKEQQYYHFKMQNDSESQKYYGKNVDDSREALKQFFYPFIEEKLLNEQTSIIYFNRYTKLFQLDGEMITGFENIKYTIHSVDIMLCPFSVGIMSIRIQLHNVKDIQSALSFAHYFRVLNPKVEEDCGASLQLDKWSFENTEQMIFQLLAPFLNDFFVDYTHLQTTIPFFEDERMYVSAFIQLEEGEEISEEFLFRAGQLNGYDKNGQQYMFTSNHDYIQRFVKKHSYDRYAPHYYMLTTLQSHMHISNQNSQFTKQMIAQFHSIIYYIVIIHYFYKLTLLKLTFENSELKYSRNKHIVEQLIEQITKFASRYYFTEVSMRAEGHELTHYFREVFRIDIQYREIKETLEELYRVQEDRAADRLNQLLFILTIFSMISGIYGMNLVIEELDEPLKWSSILGFTLFEWMAFILAIGGIAISVFLIFGQIFHIARSFVQKRNTRKKS
ncbi:sugar phosphate isomerase [Metasolibacillus sp. FSL K6-0083]|uniref:sugar phosphate isomerase n=1 Tax=Metasolibacillus sp. FSL K6-0083 TaxID=2921416 RepID=UPI0007946EA4|nr:sugar phosphate isomerase [[Bacillus] sp. KCTC 13219]